MKEVDKMEKKIRIAAFVDDGEKEEEMEICSFSLTDQAVEIAQKIIYGLWRMLKGVGCSPFKIQHVRSYSKHYLDEVEKQPVATGWQVGN